MAQVISSEEFNNLVEHIEGIAVVDFFATWCGPCKMLAPVFQEVANEFEGKADFYKIDIDASLDIARQFSVSTVPTVIIFRNGEPIERLVGFMPKENLASKIKEYIVLKDAFVFIKENIVSILIVKKGDDIHDYD